MCYTFAHRKSHPLTTCFIDHSLMCLTHFLLFHTTSVYTDSTASDWIRTSPCATPYGGLQFDHLVQSTPLTLLGCASRTKQSGTRLEKLGATARPYFHHKWHTDTVYETDLFKADSMGLKFFQTFSYAVVHFGDISAESIARENGHDQTFLYQRPLEATPNNPATQADSRA